MAQVLWPVQAGHTLVQADGVTNITSKCLCFGPRAQICQRGASKGIHPRLQTSMCTLEVQWVHRPGIWSDWLCARWQNIRKTITVSLLIIVVNVLKSYCLLSSSCTKCWFGGFHPVWRKALKVVYKWIHLHSQTIPTADWASGWNYSLVQLECIWDGREIPSGLGQSACEHAQQWNKHLRKTIIQNINS